VRSLETTSNSQPNTKQRGTRRALDMKESEFIELLNLYLDHEISAEDAARLEAEVASDPAHRRIYRQYCQMDRACSQLADQFQGTIPAADEVVARARARRNWTGGVYAAGLAAAACIAAVAILRMRSQAPQPAATAPAQVAVASVPSADRSDCRAALAVYDRQLQPVLAIHEFFLNNADGAAGPALLTGTNQNDPLAWVARMQAAAAPSVPANGFIFSPSPVMIAPDSRAPARQAPGLQAPVEMAAFRFQR